MKLVIFCHEFRRTYILPDVKGITEGETLKLVDVESYEIKREKTAI